jgi:hypothetical protein
MLTFRDNRSSPDHIEEKKGRLQYVVPDPWIPEPPFTHCDAV